MKKCMWCGKTFFMGGKMVEKVGGNWEFVCSSKCHNEGQKEGYYK